MPSFQFTFSLPSLPSLPSLNPWSRPSDDAQPSLLSTREPATIAASASVPALAALVSPEAGGKGKRGWLPAASLPTVSARLSEDSALGYVHASPLGQIRERDEGADDPDTPPTKRRRMTNSVIDLLHQTLFRSAPSPSPTHARRSSSQDQPPPYTAHIPPSPSYPLGNKRPPPSPEVRRRRPRALPAQQAQAGRARRAGGRQGRLTPSGSVGSFNPFPGSAPRTPVGGVEVVGRAGGRRVGVEEEGEEEGVVGSVPSVIDLQISRMDSTLQALLAEGAKALGEEVVVPDDENNMDEAQYEQETEEWEDE